MKPGGRFNLTDFDDNLALVIAETQDKKSSDIFESIKEQGIIKSFIHPTKTSSTWTIKVSYSEMILLVSFFALSLRTKFPTSIRIMVITKTWIFNVHMT